MRKLAVLTSDYIKKNALYSIYLTDVCLVCWEKCAIELNYFETIVIFRLVFVVLRLTYMSCALNLSKRKLHNDVSQCFHSLFLENCQLFHLLRCSALTIVLPNDSYTYSKSTTTWRKTIAFLSDLMRLN